MVSRVRGPARLRWAARRCRPPVPLPDVPSSGDVMRLTLRLRILWTLVPLLVLLLILGGAGAVLLYRLGGSIDDILRENYASVIAMVGLNESLERIDSSFQFALAGEEQKARRQSETNWNSFRKHLETEENNITLPGEGELVQQLKQRTEN